jgi:drug/metabolite transporter (DMT)-like permease
MILASLCWAASIIFIKIAVSGGDNVYNILFWSALLSLPYWVFLFSKQRQEFKKITKKDYLILISIGLISGLLASLVEMLALKYSAAINYSFLIRTSLLFTIILAYFFFDEKITLKKVLITIMILFGAFLLTTKGKMISFSLGDILTLTEAFLISFGNTILGKIAVKRMSTKLSSSVSNIIGLSLLMVIPVFMHIVMVPSLFLIICFIVLFNILGTTFRFEAYKNATASYIVMMYSLTPVYVLIIAISVLGESLNLIQLIGGALLVLSGILVEKLRI